MKKRILMLTLAALLAVSPVCFAVGNDKVAHFGVGYIINDQLKQNTKLKTSERILFVASVGAAKEIHDSRFDWNDLGATVLGAVVKEIKFERKF
jgi:hypothetical protein